MAVLRRLVIAALMSVLCGHAPAFAQAASAPATNARTARAAQNVQPTATFSAAPNIILQGGSARLQWKTSGARQISIDQGIGTVQAGGTIDVKPTQTTTYTLTMTTGNVKVTKQAIVAVITIPVRAPEGSFFAIPDSVQQGKVTRLQWKTSNARQLSIDHGIGVVQATGYVDLNPTETTTYTLTMIGARDQTITKQATIIVTALPPPDGDISAQLDTIAQGGTTTLQWKSTRATRVLIDNGIGAVTPNEAGSRAISPAQTTTYTLSMFGDGRARVDRHVTVTVTPAQDGEFSASPAAVTLGDETQLKWTSTNANNAFIDRGVGDVETAGALKVRPKETTTYTITFFGAGGAQTTKNASVTVRPAAPKPAAQVWAEPSKIKAGGATKLHWKAEGAASVTIEPDVQGAKTLPEGALDVSPAQTTTYRLIFVSANGKQDAQETIVEVAPPDAVSSTPPTTGTGQSGGGVSPTDLLTPQNLAIGGIFIAAAALVLFYRGKKPAPDGHDYEDRHNPPPSGQAAFVAVPDAPGARQVRIDQPQAHGPELRFALHPEGGAETHIDPDGSAMS